ncbi:uncharacterized protein M6B38_191080 [Iris pallida]|uniref:Uncharacterized protein n=1 Tax=Iris pallida TaxID=29817 RepID=A0AAX6EF40_IRIPA|nr:uncharacterized protein M6B38_191080 [Iris pallida]
MPDPLPACFGGVAGVPSPSPAGPSMTTSVYETLLGVASLTWSRTALGLLVRVVLRIDDDDEEEESEALSFKIRPWLLWKRRGSRRLRLKNRLLGLSWDLSRAKFPSTGGPEPSAGYSLSISIDGELVLVAGDLKSKGGAKAPSSALISRREHVAMGEERSYSTRARFGGKERLVAVDLDGEMLVEVDGKPVVQVRRLRWKFRGIERIDLGGGDRVQVSWDLHDFLFPSKKDAANPSPSEKQQHSSSSSSDAMLVFRFEREEEELEEEGHSGKEFCFGKNWNESSSSSNSNNGGVKWNINTKKKKRLAKTNSSSSSSSASSSASSTVMEWASQEEAELKGRKGGFSLLVYASKS